MYNIFPKRSDKLQKNQFMNERYTVKVKSPVNNKHSFMFGSCWRKHDS